MINAWITKGLSPKTISNKYVNFRSAMRTVYKNIDYDIIRPEKEPANIYIPTDEEVRILINASKNTPAEVAILLGAYMGMREAEIAALRWDNVDLQKRLMTVSEATSIDVDNNTVIKKPKSVSGNRTLPIPEIVCEALQRHKNDDKELVVPFPVQQSINGLSEFYTLPAYMIFGFMTCAIIMLLSCSHFPSQINMRWSEWDIPQTQL